MLQRTLMLAVVLAAGTSMAIAEDAAKGSGKQDTSTGPARVAPAPDTVSGGNTTPKGGSPKETGKAGSDGAAKSDH